MTFYDLWSIFEKHRTKHCKGEGKDSIFRNNQDFWTTYKTIKVLVFPTDTIFGLPLELPNGVPNLIHCGIEGSILLS